MAMIVIIVSYFIQLPHFLEPILLSLLCFHFIGKQASKQTNKQRCVFR